jgi:hypothetical protein
MPHPVAMLCSSHQRTYSERSALGSSIKVSSANGPAVTTITGNGVGPVVNISRTSTLAGFTIIGGVTTSRLSEGGGILVVSDSPTIFGIIIKGNSAPFGGGEVSRLNLHRRRSNRTRLPIISRVAEAAD